MNQTYQNLRSQLIGHFIDYLKADHVGYWPPALTVCPSATAAAAFRLRSCGTVRPVISAATWWTT